MIRRGIPASSTASNVASDSLIWHIHQAHQPPAEDVALSVGIGRHRGDADDGLGKVGIDHTVAVRVVAAHRRGRGKDRYYRSIPASTKPILLLAHTGTPTPKKSRSSDQIDPSNAIAAASAGQSDLPPCDKRASASD